MTFKDGLGDSSTKRKDGLGSLLLGGQGILQLDPSQERTIMIDPILSVSKYQSSRGGSYLSLAKKDQSLFDLSCEYVWEVYPPLSVTYIKPLC